VRIGLVSGPWGISADDVIASVQQAERLGFATFYLGDHFYVGQQLESWDPYLLFTLLARDTKTIQFGPLVTPVTFRPPWDLGRLAAQVDLLSGGRFRFGLGAGWSDAEHRTYGVPFPPLKERFDRLEEAIQVMRAMWGKGPASFSGRYYRLDGVDTQPKPAAGRPWIVIGGGGEKRTLKLAAQYAAEWSGSTLPPADLRHKLDVLAAHCDAAGRDPATVYRSVLSMGPIGAAEKEIDAATVMQMERTPPPTRMTPAEYRDGLRARGALTGGTAEVLDGLGRMKEAGIDEVLFVWNPAATEYLAADVLPAVAKL